jgi:DNA-binding MarR family transcriptional regulator
MAKTREKVEQQLLPLVDHLARVGRRALDASEFPGDLRPRHLIALHLLSQHGPANQQGLAEALSLDPSNVVGLLNELEDRGLITRRRDPADRRRHIVELSAEGEEELERSQVSYRVVEDDLLKALTSEERETLHELLAKAVGSNQVTCSVEDESAG